MVNNRKAEPRVFFDLLILFASSSLLVSCAAREPGIDRTNIERIITALASDDMEGRGIFTDGIERAAAFLEDEFDRIGLGKLNGENGYRQSFPYYSFSLREHRIVVGDEAAGSDEFFLTGSHDSIRWSTGDDVVIHRIKREDNFRALFRQLRNSAVDNLIIVDFSQEKAFRRYHGIFGRRSRSKTINEGNSNVYVLSPFIDSDRYEISIDRDVEKLELTNIVGQIKGKRENEFVLFSAHYDHLGIVDPIDGDSIANGANDDASGTTAVVALARHFAHSPQPERTILFALFTAEESGGMGSQHFASKLDPDQIVAMFNIEMIGKPAVEGPNTAWITGFDRSSFGQILQGAVEGSPYKFYPDPYPDENLFFRSDNATLARLGVPAHSISTTPIDVDKDYHQVSDEVSTLDLDHMTNTIRAIEAASSTIISGEATPTRISIE